MKHLLLTGPPGCGKTTLVLRIIEQLRDLRLAGFYTQELRGDDGRRGGFHAVGFKSCPTIHLKFSGAEKVEFVEIARYYDGRKAVYSLSIDNGGFRPGAHPGSPWRGADDDRSDNYQAALAVCRSHDLPVSIAIDTRGAGGDAFWQTLPAELDRDDQSWEPVESVQGSSLIQHLGHVARRNDVWYVANGCLHCYRYVVGHAQVERER